MDTWKQRVEPTLLAAYETIYGDGVPDSTVISVPAILIQKEERLTPFIADLIAREFSIQGLQMCAEVTSSTHDDEELCDPQVKGWVYFDEERSVDSEHLRAIGVHVGSMLHSVATVHFALSMLKQIASIPGVRAVTAGTHLNHKFEVETLSNGEPTEG